VTGEHAHPVGPGTDRRYLVVALVLIVAFMGFEVAMALVSGSLALLADAGHMLVDAGAIAGSLFALHLAAKPAGGPWTFGLKRAEILSALANGLTLALVALVVGVEAVLRLIHPPTVEGGIVVVVALVGVAVNLVATLVLSRADRRSLNIEGAFRHILTDLYAFIGTAVAGVLILTTGFQRADPIASLLVVALMLRAAWGLIADSGRVMLEAAPAGADPEAMGQALAQVPDVVSVHDVHLWLITSGFPALSAHVLVRPGADCHGVRQALEALLARRFGVEHTTLQVDHAQDESVPVALSRPPVPPPDPA
jgi:cobalt-zinc-cadmium efflux system protein